MAGRIRTIKPEFFFHEDLAKLDATTGLPCRLAFIGIWLYADREGRFEWRPQRLKAQIFPYDQEISFESVMDCLLDADLIQMYEIDGKRYGCIPSFNKHQAINHREAASTLPGPTRVRPGKPGNAPGEGKGKERKEGEREGEQPELSTAPPTGIPPERWQDFEEHRRTVIGRPLNDIQRRVIWKSLLDIPLDCRTPALTAAIARGLREPVYDVQPPGKSRRSPSETPKRKTALQRAEDDYAQAYASDTPNPKTDDPPRIGTNAGKVSR